MQTLLGTMNRITRQRTYSQDMFSSVCPNSVGFIANYDVIAPEQHKGEQKQYGRLRC